MVKMFEGMDRSFMMFEISGQVLFQTVRAYIIVLVVYILAKYFMMGFQYVEIALNEVEYYFEIIWNTLADVIEELLDILMTYIIEPVLDITSFLIGIWEDYFELEKDLMVGEINLLYKTINLPICALVGVFNS